MLHDVRVISAPYFFHSVSAPAVLEHRMHSATAFDCPSTHCRGPSIFFANRIQPRRYRQFYTYSIVHRLYLEKDTSAAYSDPRCGTQETS